MSSGSDVFIRTLKASGWGSGRSHSDVGVHVICLLHNHLLPTAQQGQTPRLGAVQWAWRSFRDGLPPGSPLPV